MIFITLIGYVHTHIAHLLTTTGWHCTRTVPVHAGLWHCTIRIPIPIRIR
jgi:hypothetical protein